MPPPLEEDELVVDGVLLMEVIKRRLLLWALAAPAALVLFLLIGLLAIPQSYSSEVSLAIQQPAGSSSTLAALTGQGASKKYIGILQSRTAAEEVERKVHLQQLYGLPTREKAVEMLTKGAVRVRDNPSDGLLYIDVELAGPARLRPDPTDLRHRVPAAAADTANAYAQALRSYYVTSDNERDSVLLRGAESELRQARADFDATMKRLQTYVRGLRTIDPQSVPSPDSPAPGASNTPTVLPGLYNSLAQVQADIQAAEAAQSVQSRMVEQQLQNLPKVPLDDPLLAKPRADVAKARTDLENLRVQYGEDHPLVNAARERLQNAQKELNRQVEGVKQNHTTERVKTESELSSLRAKRDDIQRQIETAESKLRVRRELSAEYDALRTEMTIRLEALKTTVAEAAKLRLSTVSAQSRATVVDDAIPAKYGQPGPLRIVFYSILLVLLTLVIWTGGAYVKAAKRRIPIT